MKLVLGKADLVLLVWVAALWALVEFCAPLPKAGYVAVLVVGWVMIYVINQVRRRGGRKLQLTVSWADQPKKS